MKKNIVLAIGMALALGAIPFLAEKVAARCHDEGWTTKDEATFGELCVDGYSHSGKEAVACVEQTKLDSKGYKRKNYLHWHKLDATARAWNIMDEYKYPHCVGTSDWKKGEISNNTSTSTIQTSSSWYYCRTEAQLEVYCDY